VTLTGKTQVGRENCHSATVSTKYLTWIDPESNSGLRGDRPASKRKIRFNKHAEIQLLRNREHIRLHYKDRLINSVWEHARGC